MTIRIKRTLGWLVCVIESSTVNLKTGDVKDTDAYREVDLVVGSSNSSICSKIGVKQLIQLISIPTIKSDRSEAESNRLTNAIKKWFQNYRLRHDMFKVL